MLRGTLPGRKPGTLAVRTSFLYAASCAALNSSGEMLISSSTCVGSSCFRVVADTRRRPPDGTTASIAPAVFARDCSYEPPGKEWSGRRDLNSRPSPWQGDALPLSYFRAPDQAPTRPSSPGLRTTLEAYGAGLEGVKRRVASSGRSYDCLGTQRLEL